MSNTMEVDFKLMRQALHDCKRHLSQIKKGVITQYMPVEKFEAAADKFFNPPEQDLAALFDTNYPFQVKALFVEDNFRKIREIIPEFIVSIIALGTDWLITLHQTEQYRKLEIINPSPGKEDLSDLSALFLSTLSHTGLLLLTQSQDQELIGKTKELLLLYQPEEYNYDIRGCFQLIYDVIVLYADQSNEITTSDFPGFILFPKEDEEKVNLLKALVGNFCRPYHILQKLPAPECGKADFRDQYHKMIFWGKYVLSAYYPVNKIETGYPKPKSTLQEKLTSVIQDYLGYDGWNVKLSHPNTFGEGFEKIVQIDRVSEPIEEIFVNGEYADEYVPSPDELASFERFEKEFGIISRSKCMLDVYEIIDDYKNTKCVLIIGDTGTGKELISQALHGVSSRKKESFIPLNCSSLPEHTVESELFGGKKGAYTDLTEDREGFFSASNGGTIFLDEIGELSLSTQAKLLRVLEDGSYTRLGDPTPRKTDCRVIAATNRNLLTAVKDKYFREDLYSRIERSIIYLPSLAKRVHDIPILSMHFLRRYADDNNFKIPHKITTTSFNILMDLEWPRNIRQLKNFVEGFMDRNKDHLKDFKPWMLKKIYEDDKNTITIKKILSQSKGKSTKIDINYPQHLITYINNGFNKLKTGRVLGIKDPRTLKGKINTEILFIGSSFNFKETEIAKNLIEQFKLQPFEQEILLEEICSQFKEIIEYCQTPHKSRPPKRAYAQECEQLAIKLTDIRSDLV